MWPVVLKLFVLTFLVLHQSPIEKSRVYHFCYGNSSHLDMQLPNFLVKMGCSLYAESAETTCKIFPTE